MYIVCVSGCTLPGNGGIWHHPGAFRDSTLSQSASAVPCCRISSTCLARTRACILHELVWDRLAQKHWSECFACNWRVSLTSTWTRELKEILCRWINCACLDAVPEPWEVHSAATRRLETLLMCVFCACILICSFRVAWLLQSSDVSQIAMWHSCEICRSMKWVWHELDERWGTSMQVAAPQASSWKPSTELVPQRLLFSETGIQRAAPSST